MGSLARRPGEFSAAQQMKMNVKHGLPRCPVAVGNHTVAVLSNSVFLGNFWNYLVNSGNHGSVFAVDVVEGGNMDFGNHQNMNRCCGRNIPKRIDKFVFVGFFGGNLSPNDFTK